MVPEYIQAQLKELKWIVSKGFQLRHHPSKQFEPFIIYDAIYLIRLLRKLKSI
ncbi:hypothetical protein LX87_04111 [Larkinella arboricola]|uniref:Uncharacterized protein n=1 Tax=Larkinella arboricola TaxID=643671 RepID=A0A327WQK6_LARAB|nr:hypothetical protein LX87_04111 [Larkinella arboricola]